MINNNTLYLLIFNTIYFDRHCTVEAKVKLSYMSFSCHVLTCHDSILAFLTSVDVKSFHSTPVNLVTSVNLNIPTDLHLIKDMFYIWKLCSLLTLLHVSLKCAIGAHLDLSWRKPVRISNWKTFIYVCFICVSPVIKILTFALWYRLYWFKMVFVSVISIFKHL